MAADPSGRGLLEDDPPSVNASAEPDRDPSLGGLTPRSSDGDDPVRLGEEAGCFWWRRVGATHLRDVFVRHPTGVRASSSDVDGHLVVAQLGEQLAHRRYAHALGTLD